MPPEGVTFCPSTSFLVWFVTVLASLQFIAQHGVPGRWLKGFGYKPIMETTHRVVLSVATPPGDVFSCSTSSLFWSVPVFGGLKLFAQHERQGLRGYQPHSRDLGRRIGWRNECKPIRAEHTPHYVAFANATGGRYFLFFDFVFGLVCYCPRWSAIYRATWSARSGGGALAPLKEFGSLDWGVNWV